MTEEYDVRPNYYQRRIFELENQVKSLMEILSDMDKLKNPPSIICCANCPNIKMLRENYELV